MLSQGLKQIVSTYIHLVECLLQLQFHFGAPQKSEQPEITVLDISHMFSHEIHSARRPEEKQKAITSSKEERFKEIEPAVSEPEGWPDTSCRSGRGLVLGCTWWLTPRI